MHPLPLAAVAVTFVNDHFLKYSFPHFVTGKLSDFTGLFYFPFFISALVIAVFRRPGLTRPLYWTSALSSYALFILMKISSSYALAFEQWFSQSLFQIKIVADASDLIALTVAPLGYWFAKVHFSREE